MSPPNSKKKKKKVSPLNVFILIIFYKEGVTLLYNLTNMFSLREDNLTERKN